MLKINQLLCAAFTTADIIGSGNEVGRFRMFIPSAIPCYATEYRSNMGYNMAWGRVCSSLD